MISRRGLNDFAALVVLFITVVHISGNDVCKDLPVISNGELELEGRNPPFNVNDHIRYSCNDNFRTDEIAPTVTCVLQNNVTNWTEGACKPIVRSCHDPGDIENADRDGSMFTYPHSITYRCNEGFKIKGIATKYCSITGQWQPPSMPYCEAILCPHPSDPPNGAVTFSNRHFNSIAAYKCNKLYKLVGYPSQECQADGTWSGSIPTCEKITCVAPGEFPNGRIIGKKNVYSASDILIFQCNAGGIHSSSKCLENGEWNTPPPVCPGPTHVESSTTPASTTVLEIKITEQPSEDCTDPGDISNGSRVFIGLHVNSTVTYTCDEGYQLRGKSTLRCLQNGKWDLNKLPICVKTLTAPEIIGIVCGVIILICLVIGGYFLYKYKMKSIRGYGEKSKALTADATDIEEIAGLGRDKKQIPVTVL